MTFKQSISLALLLAAPLLACDLALGGTVITDGSLGRATTFTGPNYSIPSSLGTLHGGNLFESFQTLNLSPGDVATFSGPSTVTDVLARVTGGSPSNINGTIQCTIPHAAFYLINPSGVIFGPSAALDVKDSFVVTTADQVKLADGHVFGTPGASDATLTSASPAAFGFLAKQPAALTINGALLRVPTGRGITLAAGSIALTAGATVRAPQGSIGVLSVASPTVATLSPGHAPTAAAGTTFGDVTMEQDSFLKTTDAGGGRIEVNANDLTLTDSAIDARTLGAIDGEGISVQLTGTLANSDSSIFTNTDSSGNAGGITVNAENVQADNGVSAGVTGIAARSLASNGGAGGQITIRASNLSLADGQQINATTFGSGHGGSIAVIANRVSIQGFANNAGAAPSGLLSDSVTTGVGGQIRVHAGTLRVESGGVILCGTAGSGSGGDLSVTADQLVVDGTSEDNPTGITTATDSSSLTQTGFLSIHSTDVHVLGTSGIESQTAGSGAAGLVTLRADSLSLAGGGEVASQTFASGTSGSVAIDVKSLHMDGGAADMQTTEISAGTGLDSAGAAGNVTVTANSIDITDSADITTNTFAAGSAGNVSVAAKTIQIDGRNADGFTGIDSNAQEDTTGNAGSVVVKADSLSVVAGGEISSDTDGTGRAGNVAVVANQIKLDGRGSDLTARISSDSEASNSGAAGSVRVHGDDVRLIYGSQIESSTSSAAPGGEVSLTANKLIVNGTDAQSFTAISALAEPGSSGRAGDVSVHAGEVEVISSGGIATDTEGTGSGGNIQLTADSLTIDSAGSSFETAVSSSAGSSTSGSAGEIDINAGKVHLVNNGAIVSDSGGSATAGSVRLHAGLLDMNGAGNLALISSSADPGSTGNAGEVEVKANSINLAAGAEIASTTSGAGNGGDVAVIANQFNMDGAGGDFFTGVAADTLAAQTGRAGSIRIHAGSINMTEEARIDDDSNGSGNGGNISITAGQFRVDGLGAAKFTGVSAVAEENTSGDSGSIAVRSDDLELRSGAGISAETFGSGNGGDVSVTSNRIVADGRGSAIPTQINASALAANSGSAGNVQVTAHDVHLIAATINSETDSAGSGGNVSVRAASFIANSEGASAGSGSGIAQSGISAQANAGSSGGAGSITASFDIADLVDGGVITSSTFGSGNGGDVVLHADSLAINGASAAVGTGILADSNASATGHAGSISADIGNASITAGGLISSSTFGPGNGGDVNVKARNLLIDAKDGAFVTGLSAESRGSPGGTGGDVNVFVNDDLTLRGDGSIAAIALHANGGNIAVTGKSIDLQRAYIATSAAGAGGDIAIDAVDPPGDSLVIAPGGEIAAVAGGTARTDNGGNVTIGRTALAFLPGVGKDAITANANQGNGGNITIDSSVFLTPPGTPSNAIDSSSLGGLAGKITIQTPNIDLSGILVPLVSSLNATGVTLAPSCGMLLGPNQSSFTLEGGNGLALEPGESQPSPPEPATQPVGR